MYLLDQLTVEHCKFYLKYVHSKMSKTQCFDLKKKPSTYSKFYNLLNAEVNNCFFKLKHQHCVKRNQLNEVQPPRKKIIQDINHFYRNENSKILYFNQ